MNPVLENYILGLVLGVALGGMAAFALTLKDCVAASMLDKVD